MLQYHMEITKLTIREIIYSFIDEQLCVPYYLMGYFVEIVSIAFGEPEYMVCQGRFFANENSNTLRPIITYRLHEDKEYTNITERLQIGL